MKLAMALRILGPRLAKAAAVLAPLLKNERVQEALIDSAGWARGKSPAAQLRAKIQATTTVADALAGEATTDEARARAEGWAKQAGNLLRVLDLPSASVRTHVSKLASIRRRLGDLQDEIEHSLVDD